MSQPAFAAWLSKPGWFNPEERSRFAQAAQAADLPMAILSCGAMVASTDTADGQGARIFGRIYRRGRPVPLAGVDLASLGQDATDVRRLVEDHWGDYVAIGPTPGDRSRFAMRAPFGDLPCYWRDYPDHVVLASSIRLLMDFGEPRTAIDWQAIGHFLAATDLRMGRTCLRDIQELSGGQMMRVSRDGIRIEPCWSPWEWTTKARRFTSREAAADALRAAVDTCVRACLSPGMPSVLLLSGGLDSSIVAAALARGASPVACLTMVVDDLQGDEREHARAVATHLGLPLSELTRNPRDVDLTRPLTAHLPRPTGAQFRQATFAAADALAHDLGAAQVLDGGGGDNMFCSLQSAAPVVDAILGAGTGTAPFATAASIARMANVSAVSVLRHAVARIISRRVAYRWPIDRTLLDAAVLEGFSPNHPWLVPPQGTPPGKAAHVALLLAANAVVESPDAERHPLIRSPLVSQPIAEAALRIPSWMWFEEGRNRAPIRRAYAKDLPSTIIGRRSKGTPTGFLAALVEQDAASLRPFLLDGLLAANAVIDRAAVEAALRPGPARDLGFARLLQIADAEAWARSWH